MECLAATGETRVAHNRFIFRTSFGRNCSLGKQDPSERGRKNPATRGVCKVTAPWWGRTTFVYFLGKQNNLIFWLFRAVFGCVYSCFLFCLDVVQQTRSRDSSNQGRSIKFEVRSTIFSKYKNAPSSSYFTVITRRFPIVYDSDGRWPAPSRPHLLCSRFPPA